MEKNSEKKSKPNFISTFDLFGEQLSWNIEGDPIYKTVIGGIESILIILISLAFLIYSFVKFLYDREGSYLFYDEFNSDTESANINYFEDLEIFLNFKNSNLEDVEIDTDIIYPALSIYSNDSTLISHKFEKCDNSYFINQLGLNDNIKEQITYTYCLNKTEILNNNNNNFNFNITPLHIFGFTQNPVSVQILPTKLINSTSTEDSNNITQEFLEETDNIPYIYIFFKTYIDDPLNMNHPKKKKFNSIVLTNHNKAKTVYLKNFYVKSDNGLFPYISPSKEINFITFDSSEDNLYYSNYYYVIYFGISLTTSFLERTYDKLDDVFAKFFATYEILEIIINVLLLLFSFHKHY